MSPTKLKSIALSVMLTCVSGSHVLFADDTEVFFGAQTAQSTSNPNVLFILDTSGSMGGKDGTGISRIDRMKAAVQDILNSATNINVGLMRFNGHKGGGAVIYPATYIDQELCPNGTCSGSNPYVQLEVRVDSSDDDATEQTSSLDVTTDDPVLMLFENAAAASIETKTYKLTHKNSDATEATDGSYYTRTSTDTDIFYDTWNGKTYNAGFHFNNIDIEPGALIVSAKVTHKGLMGGNGNDVAANIYIEDTLDPRRFNNNAARRVNIRPRSTTVVNWPQIPYVSFVDEPVDTPDISSLISDRVNAPGWVSGNNLALIYVADLTHTAPSLSSYRQFRSYDAVGSSAAELSIGVQDSNALQKLGVRFDDLRIPQGATITSASLEFTSNSDNSSPAAATIRGHDIDDSPKFTTSNGNISSRSQTSASTSWTPSNWSSSLGAVQEYQTDDISQVIQEIVDRTGWCGGNALSLILEGTGLREAVSYDNTPSQAPVLKVDYDATNLPSNGGCTVSDAQASVAYSSDDMIEQTTRGRSLTTTEVLEVPYSGSNEQLMGLRFQNLLIPNNATITSAYMTFRAAQNPSGTSSLTIAADADTTPLGFSGTSYELSSRTETSATVDWLDVASTPVGESVTTPDISSIVQELVNRSSWSSGGNMVFKFARESGSGTRGYESYNGDPLNAPKLNISYKVMSGTVAATTGSSQITYQTTRDKLTTILDDMVETGGTPIIGALFEAAKYFTGAPIDYGDIRGAVYRDQRHRVSHPDSYTGGSLVTPNGCDTDLDPNNSNCKNEIISGSPVYISPMNDSCQSNHMVLLSDGSPSVEKSSLATGISNFMGGVACSSNSSSKKCGVELLSFLRNNDQSSTISGTQDITTHTIGFNFNSTWMEQLAAAGGGSYYEASNTSNLVDAFNSILASILKVDTSFVSPGATVNQFNRLTHRNDIYFSLFKPSETPTWEGNLKQYRLAGDPAEIVDANTLPAIDESTGFFKETAMSYWSDSVDGTSVGLGGAANEISLSGRKVYTYTGSNSDLTHSTNNLHETNSALTKAMLDVTGQTDAYKFSLVQWARGVDVKDTNSNGSTTDVRKHMGDPMHSRPLIYNYADNDSVLFVATNEGFLHAIDSDDGSEIYTFIPQELLPNLDKFYTNSSAIDHPYGLDGAITTWTDPDTDKVYLYIGMRRGGNKYYALDITDRDSPKLKWIIDGDSTTGFSSLGQTWSSTLPATIDFNGTPRNVLIFSGGYDESQDDATTTQTDSTGNAIYIVDAVTGELIWSAGNTGSGAKKTFSEMKYSIPSDISLIDINSDGYTDQFYVGDMGGQIWRFDIDSTTSSTSELVKGGVMAKFSDSGTSNARRFFYAPDIAILSDMSTSHLTVSIGSGWRSHPLDNVIDDRFYSFRTEDIYTAPTDYGISNGNNVYRPITESDLIDVTDNLNADMSSRHGWMLQLESSGEKVLAKSTTVNNQVLFTTYRPEAASTSCSAALGQGALYTVHLYDGSPTSDQDESGDSQNFTKSDRSITLNNGGIPPEVVILFPTASTDTQHITSAEPIALVGPEKVSINIGNLTKRTFWQTPAN